MIALALLGMAVAEAAGPRVIPAGTAVQIVEISPKDAFWRFRGELLGSECVVGETALVRRKGRWYGGELACDDGQPYYFYQVRVFVGSYGGGVGWTTGPEPAPPELALDPDDLAMVGTPDKRDGDGVVVAGASPARETPAPVVEAASEWAVGAPVRIRAVSAADATSTRAPPVAGMACTVQEPLTRTGDAWVSGTLRCAGADTFFYQVALDAYPTAGAAAGSVPAGRAGRKADGRLTGEVLPAGRMVRIVDVAAQDANHADRARLVGTTCTVTEAALMPSGDGWYAGRLFCGEMGARAVSRVAVAPL